MRVGHLIVLAPLAIGCADADKAPECREGTRLAANGACEPVVDTGSGEPSEHPGTGDDTASADDSGTPASPSDSGTPATPSDSGIFVVEPPPASWNLEEVGVAFDGLMATGVPDPWTVQAAWRDMFDGADWLCPGDGYNISSGAVGCISDDGWRYAGLARYEEIDADGEVTTVLNSDGYITDADGNTMWGGGSVGVTQIAVDGGHEWFLDLSGTWGLDNAPEPWFAAHPSLYMNFLGTEIDGERTAQLLGGWSFDGQSVSFNTVVAPDCDGHSGSVHIRDPGGAWYVVELACGTCGPVMYAETEEMGELCLDLSGVDALVERLLGGE